MQKERQVPVRNRKLTPFSADCDSAIGQHLHVLENQDSDVAYNDSKFLVLATPRLLSIYQLSKQLLSKNVQIVACSQKDFVYALQLVH